MAHKYFYLREQGHHMCAVAGDRFDGNAYHQAPENRDSAQWKFVPNGSTGYFYIIDRRHQAGLGAGDQHDWNIYHYTDYRDRLNAQWRVEPTQTPGIFRLFDRKHGKALVAGNRSDGHLYHADPGERRVGTWKLELVEDTAHADEGPRFYVAKEELVAGSLTFQTDQMKRYAMPPMLVIEKQAVRNLSDLDQEFTFEQKTIDRVAEIVTVQHSGSFGYTFSKEFGTGAILTDSKVEIEASFKYAFTHSDSTLREFTNSITMQVPVKAPAKSTVYVDATLKRNRTRIPFKYSILRTLGDGTTSRSDEEGVWESAEYLTGDTKFSSGPNVETDVAYYLVNKHSKKALDVAGAWTAAGGTVQQWARHERDNQHWLFEPAGGGYYFVRAKHSGLYLDVAGYSKDDGAGIQQWTLHRGDNQQWRLESAGGSYVVLRAKHSDKAIGVNGASIDDGAATVQWTRNTSDDQVWQLVRVP